MSLVKAVDAQGHPQCRRKLTTVGLPSGAGILSLGVEGAALSTAGVSEMVTGDGDIHDQNSLCQVIVSAINKHRT
jgi:hypothetical protein